MAEPRASRALEAAMAASPVFAVMPSDATFALARAGAIRRFDRGTYLFHQGDVADAVHVLLTGRIEISAVAISGERALRATLEPPQLFGELGVLGRMPRTASALALEPCDVWSLAADRFVAALGDHPPAALRLLEALASQLVAHESLVDDLLFLDLRGRVAKRLLSLAVDGVVPETITQADLAALAGGSRENVSRILSDLNRRGIVARDGRRYELKDVSALRRLAGLDPV